jgi:hypothetical protein
VDGVKDRLLPAGWQFRWPAVHDGNDGDDGNGDNNDDKAVDGCVTLGVMMVAADGAWACDGTGTMEFKKLQATIACSHMEKHGITAVEIGDTSASMTVTTAMAQQLQLAMRRRGFMTELDAAFSEMVSGLTDTVKVMFPETPTATLQFLSPGWKRLLTVKANGETF